MTVETPTVELPRVSGVHHATPAAAAARRVDYRLVYDAQRAARKFAPGVMSGGTAPGSSRPAAWYDPRPVADPASEAQWITSYMGMAVQEAVHCVLAAFCVDGAPAIDPDGPAGTTVRGCVEELTAKLAIIATTPHLHRPH